LGAESSVLLLRKYPILRELITLQHTEFGISFVFKLFMEPNMLFWVESVNFVQIFTMQMR
jgi:hypothetical protein